MNNELTDQISNNNPISYAYIAGLLEGEGCFLISREQECRSEKGKGPSYRPQIGIQMRDKIPLEFLVSMFPKNIYCHNSKFKVQYRTNQTIDIINKIFPYLTFKQDQAQTLLDLHDTKQTSSHIPVHLKEYRHQLYLLCRKYKEKRVKDYGITTNINPPENLVIPSQTDLSYLAGIIDGEGSIGIYNHKHKERRPTITIQLSLGMTRLEPLLKLQTHFGGTICVYNRVFVIKFVQMNAITILQQLIPYLKLKEESAKICVQFYNTKDALTHQEKQNLILRCQECKYKHWTGPYVPFKKISKDISEIQKEIINFGEKRIKKQRLSQESKLILVIEKAKQKIVKLVDSISKYYRFHTPPGLYFTMPQKIISVSRLDLKGHLERHFETGMNWDNFQTPNGWDIILLQNSIPINYINIKPIWK